MGQVLGLKFRDHGQLYYFDSGPFVVRQGDHVIVKTEQGMGLGQVTVIREDTPDDLSVRELKTIFRLAAEEDLRTQQENQELAVSAKRFCKRCIEERKLEMKLVEVEVYFDRSKIIFYFTAPGRIDFRELVKDLVREYRTRIELRQIGVRHETQMLGAVGNCGQMACCKRFMRKFEPVTIKMAKEQNLFLNPTKISGICGRLLCCLAFEEENYERFYHQCPKIGKRHQTDQGAYKVLRANFFRESLSLLSDKGEEVEMPLEDWQAMHPRPMEQQNQQRQSGDRQQSAQEHNSPEPRKDDNGLKRPPKPQEEPKPEPQPEPGPVEEKMPEQNTQAGGEEAKVKSPKGKAKQQAAPRSKASRSKRKPRKRPRKAKGGKSK